MSKRFSVLTSYTLSKSQDHAGEAKQTGTSQTNPFDLEFDWGYANADRRHRFVTSALWQIPGEFDNGVMAAVLSDWSLTGILAMQSGGGFTVTSGVDNARTGTGGQRADVSGDPTLSSDRPNSEKILRVVRHVGVRPERAGHVWQLGAQQPARARLEERRSGTPQDRSRPAGARSCRCGSRPSTCSTG